MKNVVRGLITCIFLGIFPTFSIYPIHADTIDVFCKPVNSSPRVPANIAQPSTLASIYPEAITFVTNCGEITVSLNSKYAPTTATALLSLISGSYYDNTLCNRITTSGIFIIQCGDPTSTGQNIPIGWSGYADENLPISKENNYPTGTVGMANSGPKTNGAQFFFVYKDTTLPPSYSIWGNVISGTSIINYVSTQGAQLGSIDGPLKQPLLVEKVILRDKQWMSAFTDGRTESIRSYEEELAKVADLPKQNETLKTQIDGYVKVSNNQLAQITNLELQVSELKVQIEKLSIQTAKTTITCTKGKVTKKVTAVKPKCPAGYKKK
jgi:peptidyl-prolyl cis-trans isomerase B (cyclophilin B)